MTKRYITTAIPYMNGNPHIGHAMDYCLADVCARYYKICGDEVRFQAGTDEHGGKIAQKAAELGLEEQEFVDKKTQTFVDFIKLLGVEYTDFVRTTSDAHIKRVQEIWTKLKEHIYMGDYEGWYCTGCERFITEKEYEENKGICPDHNKPYERLKEKNYYLRVADFKEQIREAIESDIFLILPEFRKREVLGLLNETEDVSISRPRTQLEWGVPVPGDETQVMYVWIDALSNYITVLGYPERDISDFWPATAQFVGKDILRFHAIIWPAMLLGLGLPLPKALVSHGMILANGQKMSKTIGNVVDPVAVVEKYGVDAFRYFFLRNINTFNDSDFTWGKFESAYKTELANDLGNLVQRLAALTYKNNVEVEITKDFEFSEEYKNKMENFEFSDAFDLVWEKVRKINQRIDNAKPWAMAKEGEIKRLKECLESLINDLLAANHELKPFLPNATARIERIFTADRIQPPETPLFPKE